jgi:hypothetical protein
MMGDDDHHYGGRCGIMGLSLSFSRHAALNY